MIKLKHNLDIIILLVVGFVLRYSVAIKQSYSNDELSAIKRLSFDNLSDLIELGVKTGDMHPAGVQLFMKLWSLIGGTSEAWMRLPFVIFGVISIFLIFKIGHEFVNRKVGIIAAIFLTFLYFPILNSEFARPYSPGLMFSLLSAYFYLKILCAEKPTIKQSIYLGISAAVVMYTHYFAFLFLAWMGLFGLLFIRRHQIKYVIIAFLTASILFIPHIPVTVYHLNVGGLQWLGPPHKLWLFEFLFFSLNSSYYLLIGLIMLLILSFVFKAKNEMNAPAMKAILLFIGWFFGIYLLGHIVSIIGTPVLKFPVMLFAFPFFLLLIGAILSRFKYQTFLVFILTAGIGVSTIYEKKIYEPVHHELFKEVTVKLHQWNEQYGNENIVSIYNLNDPYYMNFYANQLGDTVDFDMSVLEFGDAVKVRNTLKDEVRPYCIVGYSARLTLHQVFESCREFYPFIVDYEKHNNSAVFLLSKYYRDQNYRLEAELVDEFNPAISESDWEYNPNKIIAVKDSVLGVEKYAYELGGKEGFGPTKLIEVAEIKSYRSKYIKVNVFGEIPEKGELTITVSAERDGKAVYHRNEVFWLGHDVEEMMIDKGYGYFAFEIPEFLHEEDQLKIGLWNRNTDVAVHIHKFQILAYPNVWN